MENKESPIGALAFMLLLSLGYVVFAGLDLYRTLTIFATQMIHSSADLPAILEPSLRGLLLCISGIFCIGRANFLIREEEEHAS